MLPGYDNWKTNYPEDDGDHNIEEMCEAILAWRRSYVETIESMINEIKRELNVIARDGEEEIRNELIWIATSRLHELLDEFKDTKIDY